MYALISIVFGAFACVYEFYQPSGHAGYIRYAVTTMGITSLFFGIVAFRSRSRRIFSWLLPCVGVVLGGIGTIATIASMSFFFANPSAFSGDLLPGPAPTTPATSTPAPSSPVSQPPPSATTTSPTLTRIDQTLGSLAFALQQTRTPDRLWPSTLGSTPTGGVFNPFGDRPDLILVTLPEGTTLQYQASSDRTSFAMRLSSIANPTVAAEYSSLSGMVANE